MINTIKLEIKKAILNKFFLFSIVIGISITMLSFLEMVNGYFRDMNSFHENQLQFKTMYNPVQGGLNLFNHWIGGETFTLGTSIYFFVFPILIALPFGWSYCSEKKSGYVRNMVIRCGKKNYFLAKVIAVFVSGGFAMVLPLLFNFILTGIFVPAVKPDPIYLTMTGVWGAHLMSMLYYSHPFLFVILYLMVDFIFCGLIACLCLAVTVFLKNRVAAVLFPLLFSLAFHYSEQYFFSPTDYYHAEISPLYFLHPVTTMYPASWLVIIVEGSVLFFITYYLTVVRGEKSDIY